MNKITYKTPILFFILIFLCITNCFAVEFPNKPSSGQFYVDEARIISTKEGIQINQVSAKLLKEKGVPLFVVTIPSLTGMKAFDTPIEAYARALFDFWGIGSQVRNYGILFLISKDDRKARIELGASYGRQYDQASSQIMSSEIVPRFKAGDYSAGILAGVVSLDKMVRGVNLPATQNQTAPPTTQSKIIGIILLIIFVALIISLFRSGRSGWAWALLAGLFALLLYSWWRGGGNGSGGSSGGGFGGGSSGGGGSTGSW